MDTKLENICEIPKNFPTKTCELEVKYILLQHIYEQTGTYTGVTFIQKHKQRLQIKYKQRL